MRNLIIILIITTFLFSCEKTGNITTPGYTAKITGYDLNCSTCILSFPFDSMAVQNELGSSPENLYHAVNLNRGDMQIGQMVKVEVRKAMPEEVNACIALYPSPSYQNVFVTKVEDFTTFNLNDTILLPYQECQYNAELHAYVCFESVLSDSRCPEGAECIWAGDAKARFKFIRTNADPVFFNLNTTASFVNDTIIDGIKFTLLDLKPYPSLSHHPAQNEYKAELKIEQAKSR